VVLDVAVAPRVPGALIDVADETPAPLPGAGLKRRRLDRRRFLSWAWKILGAGLVVDAGWTSYDLLRPQKTGGFGGVIDAGSVGDYPEGAVQYFPTGRFYVTSSEGKVVALFQKCPHLGCRVPFCDSSGRFECPCHGSIYNIRGEYIQGPAPRGMDRFPIKVQGDKVLVDTSDVVEGPARGVSSVSSEAKGPPCAGESGASGTSGGGTM
jgi:cytochrome b6-f complex iron-sulfur subunit